MDRPLLQLSDEPTEEELHQRIAFYKARLMDIQKAPEGSPHRRGWREVSRRLQECRRRLSALQARRRNGRILYTRRPSMAGAVRDRGRSSPAGPAEARSV